MGVLGGAIVLRCDNADCAVDQRVVYLDQVAPDVVAVPGRLLCRRCGREMWQVGEPNLGV